MRTNQSRVRVVLVIGLAVAATACGRQGDLDFVTAVQRPPGAVTCPTYGATGARDIGRQGGSVVAEHLGTAGTRRHGLTVPREALGQNEELSFWLTEPPATYLTVHAHHNDVPDKKFAKPLTLRISYRGCNVPNPANLGIYRWDPTKPVAERWQRMPNSRHDPDEFYVEVDRETLSQYALGGA